MALCCLILLLVLGKRVAVSYLGVGQVVAVCGCVVRYVLVEVLLCSLVVILGQGGGAVEALVRIVGVGFVVVLADAAR